jgi:glycosyltransferase involved in cell wall biosynthesis
MRIVFTVIGNSRRSNYLNGETIRYGGGGASGTDTSTILVAEYLASKGHDVVFATEMLEKPIEQKLRSQGIEFISGKEIRGVKYCNMSFDGIENKEFDILVNTLWYHDYKKLPIKVTKSVIYWSHMQWIYGIDEVGQYCKDNNLSLGFVHISEWEKKMTSLVVERAKIFTDRLATTLIPNPVAEDIIRETLSKNIVKKKHKFIFHAAWARGGNVAVDAVRQLGYPDSQFHAFDYLMCIHAHNDPWFNLHNGVDKSTLFKHIAESEYFLYPLYTPYKDVHKDTFSCVVAEAIALGTTVVTYPLGALPEYFGEYCAWADAPNGANFDKMNSEPLSRDEVGIFNTPEKIVEVVKKLEQNPTLKNKIQSEGANYILGRFGINTVGSMWETFINNLTNV